MILVTLGTQDKKFTRLLEAIDKEIQVGNITDDVVVQAGKSADYKSENMKIFDLISMDEFEELVKKCDFLITHGGVGSIIQGLKNNKKIIAVPRLKKYKEHTNDHQIQIVNNFSECGYILKLNNMDQLPELLTQIKSFKPKKFISNNKKFVSTIENIIDNL